MDGIFKSSLLLIAVLLMCDGLAIPKPEGSSKRIHENILSDEMHYIENEFHNADYDHEAFLGETEAKRFADLSSEESKSRLGKIVDKIDSDKNGFVSLQELKDWILLTQKRYIFDDSDRQWRGLNPNNETEVSWESYKTITYGINSDTTTDDMAHYQEMMDRDARRWKKADQDQNGSLNKQEFQDFVHPEESLHMKDIIVVETLEDIDKDKDGKVSMEEYIGDMLNDGEIDEEPSWVHSEREQFTQFRDKDKSGFMEFDEIKHWILPDDYDNSDAEAKHLIYESDVNRDNQLSKEEILNKFDLFVGSQATDFGEALARHDEF